MFKQISDSLMRAAGWTWEGQPPDAPKFVLLGAPHTSLWDFWLLLAVCNHWKLPVKWMGKHSMFAGPLGPFMKAIGGIPIRRDARYNTVTQVVDMINKRDRIVLGLAPKGTRNPAAKWKTGFWHIANGAQIPISMGFVDGPSKRIGIGPTIMPSGDIAADMKILKDFYAPLKGVCPEKTSPIEIADTPPS